MEHGTGQRATLHAGYPMGVMTAVGLDQKWVGSSGAQLSSNHPGGRGKLISVHWRSAWSTQQVRLHGVFIYTAHSRHPGLYWETLSQKEPEAVVQERLCTILIPAHSIVAKPCVCKSVDCKWDEQGGHLSTPRISAENVG